MPSGAGWTCFAVKPAGQYKKSRPTTELLCLLNQQVEPLPPWQTAPLEGMSFWLAFKCDQNTIWAKITILIIVRFLLHEKMIHYLIELSKHADGVLLLELDYQLNSPCSSLCRVSCCCTGVSVTTVAIWYTLSDVGEQVIVLQPVSPFRSLSRARLQLHTCTQLHA